MLYKKQCFNVSPPPGTQRCLPRYFSIPSRGRVAVEFGLPLPPPPKEVGLWGPAGQSTHGIACSLPSIFSAQALS